MNKTKKEIFNFFDGVISKKAIKEIDGEYMVVGHKCQIALEDNDMLDVWICNPKDISIGLGTEAVRNRLLPFQQCGATTVRELTGEGYARGRVKDIVLQNIALLGIQKKKVFSPELLNEMTLRIEKVRQESLGDTNG